VSGAPRPQLTEPLTTGIQETARVGRAPGRNAFLLVQHREGVEAITLVPGAGVGVGREPPPDGGMPPTSL
jgi:hypothetical protein